MERNYRLAEAAPAHAAVETRKVVGRVLLPIALGLAALGLVFGLVRAAHADMAPLPAQSGASFGTASATDIRLISETVILAVTNVVITNDSGYAYTQTGAAVTADFLLLNPEAGPQSLQVGFPLEIPAQAVQAGSFARLHGLRAFVAGSEAETNIVTVGQETWSAWQMSFAPGNTSVRVTYDLPATVDACNTELGYVLHTGAAWAGPIGRADLIMRYPYAAEATFVSPGGIYLGNSTPGYRVEGTDLHWHYDNLKPTPADDLAVTFVAPDCWRPVAAARAALIQHATAVNYWNLAEAYAAIVFPHHGFYSPLIAQVADAQFQKALALDPQNPQINAGYAEFLFFQVGQGQLLPASHQPDKIQQCSKALLLAPQDDMLESTCGSFLQSQIGDTSVAASVQSTVAAVLTVVAQPTVPSPMTATPISPAATPGAVASPSPLPSALSTPRLTETPPEQPSSTASPPAAATATPIAVAQVTAIVAPTAAATPAPQAQPAPASPLPLILIGLALLLVVVVVRAYYWRRKPAGNSNR